jgi:hypothetical protein
MINQNNATRPNATQELKDVHKELLYYLVIRQYSCQRVACMREQTERNIRKVKDTILRKLRKKAQDNPAI